MADRAWSIRTQAKKAWGWANAPRQNDDGYTGDESKYSLSVFTCFEIFTIQAARLTSVPGLFSHFKGVRRCPSDKASLKRPGVNAMRPQQALMRSSRLCMASSNRVLKKASSLWINDVTLVGASCAMSCDLTESIIVEIWLTVFFAINLTSLSIDRSGAWSPVQRDKQSTTALK